MMGGAYLIYSLKEYIAQQYSSTLGLQSNFVSRCPFAHFHAERKSLHQSECNSNN